MIKETARDLRTEFDIVGEYLVYADRTEQNGYACRYEASEQIRHSDNERDFLVVEDWTFIREFNAWLSESKYHDRLVRETGSDLSGDKESDKYFTNWIDYLTDDMWGFGDEYSVCNNCCKVFRTSPNSYSWKPDYWAHEEMGLCCGNCIRKNKDIADAYVDCLINESEDCNTILSDSEMEELGFEKLNGDSFENGWYGIRHDPKVILERYTHLYPGKEFVFSIAENQQFATFFDIYGRDR